MPSEFASNLAKTAEEQWKTYHDHSEADPILSKQIRHYWEDLKFKFPGVSEQWSAVFISWCIKKAGAESDEFKFAQRHAIFVKWAINNSKIQQGMFRGYKIDDYKPQVGDILVNNQPGNSYDFEYASGHDSYHSHSAIVVERGVDHNGEFVLTVGGNETDSVRHKIVHLDNGFVRQRKHLSFIAIIQNLK